ncbi:MAG: alanyl-tRNA editing protein [Acidaminococcaceae bacterium]|nr:alanyl-tRNA editing protein [Acidaminococcaceae bacterium]
MTEKLFERDSNLKICEATVVECEPAPQGYAVVLDRTVLFPEGGGQLSDTGTINGALVKHVRETKEKIIHECAAEFPVGSRVTVQVNWTDRLDHMQQHCGEHILSYAFWKLFGANNVGFHMNERMVTIDLDKEVTLEEAFQAEDFANRQVWEDLPVTVSYLPHTELADLPMRKKNEKLTGILRVVAVRDGDVCTCCGTHPTSTGVVGLIKITKIEKHKGGTRVEFLCGRWALEDARKKMRYIQDAGNMLSTKEERVCESIGRLEGEISELKEKLRAAVAQLQESEIQKLLAEAPVNAAGCQVLAAIKDEYEPKSAKTLFGKLSDMPNALVAVIYRNGERVNYMFGLGPGAAGDCKAIIARANEIFGGKGGGKKESAQGGAPYAADWKEKAEKLVAVMKET